MANQHLFVVFNPKSGNATAEFQAAVAKHFPEPDWQPEIYEITGEEDVSAVCRDACERGAAIVIAAGGDGTVVSVANGLVNSPIPLGIVPLGTGNDMARILNIPLNLDGALALIAGDHSVIAVDGLKVDAQVFLSNVSVGISPHVMKDTKSEHKQRFGLLAYVWTMITRSSLFQLHHYTLTIDDNQQTVYASEVLISNTPLRDYLPTAVGASDTLHDGQLEVYLVTARTIGDYLRLVWGLLWDLLRRPTESPTTLFQLNVKERIRIEGRGGIHLVQADGEVIGHTPVEVELIRNAFQVIMPKLTPDKDAHATPKPLP